MNLIKRTLCAALVGTMLFGTVACSGDTGTVPTVEGDYVTGDRTYSEYEDLSEYVKVGQYKGLTLEITGTEVTDADVEAAIASDLFSKSTTSERKDGQVADGDIVNIDYIGYVDGETSDGMQAEGYNLTIGSGAFIEGFEASLIEMPVGETVTIELAFPDPYPNNPDLAGKPAKFDVTINYVLEMTQPALTDEFVKSISSAKTVAEYRELKRAELQKSREDGTLNDKMNKVWATIQATSEVIKYPEKQLHDYRDEFMHYYNQAAAEAGVSLEKHLKDNYGVDIENFETDALDYASDYVKNDLIFRYIVRTEGIEITDEAYSAGLENFYQSYGKDSFKSALEFEEYYGKSYVVDNLLWYEMLNYLIEQNEFVAKK